MVSVRKKARDICLGKAVLRGGIDRRVRYHPFRRPVSVPTAPVPAFNRRAEAYRLQGNPRRCDRRLRPRDQDRPEKYRQSASAARLAYLEKRETGQAIRRVHGRPIKARPAPRGRALEPALFLCRSRRSARGRFSDYGTLLLRLQPERISADLQIFLAWPSGNCWSVRPRPRRFQPDHPDRRGECHGSLQPRAHSLRNAPS